MSDEPAYNQRTVQKLAEEGRLKPFPKDLKERHEERLRQSEKTASMTPRRVQRRREKGWRMPPNTVYVGRPTRWGNPFKGDDAVERYRTALDQLGQRQLDAFLEPLFGLDLLCWCPLDSACHADVLLEYANGK